MILNETKLTSELQNKFDRNVFIMMRYRLGTHFINIEEAIKKSLAKYGLISRLAKDCAFSDDLWENIQLYMKGSKLGIAVFEEIDEREFNPNISLELGYMYALGRRCLLLKDKRMPRLPTDTCGKIYRDFDVYDLPASVDVQVSDWCERDLGLTPSTSGDTTKTETGVLIFDSTSEDQSFRTWGIHSSIGMFAECVKLVTEEGLSGSLGEIQAIEITARATEGAGINKDVQTLVGKVKFDYKAIHSGADILNLYFCMIPMQKEGHDRHLIEVGTDRCADPINAYSPYRQRYYVPHNHIGDGQWHKAEIAFDFRNTPTAAYSIFGARVNEGCPKPGAGKLLVTNVQMISYESDGAAVHRRAGGGESGTFK
jgi:hypothetical protein